jgi:carboxypeptidase family protein
VIALLVSPGALLAQGVGTSAEVEGTVTDPAGKDVPDVQVTLVNTAQGISRTAITDGEGHYLFLAVPPAAYDIRADHPAFNAEIKKGVVLSVGQHALIDFTLKISPVKTELVVSGQPPVVETARIQQANTIGQNFIRELPIDRRDYLAFTLLAPGVADSKAFADNTDFRVAQTPQSGLSFYGSNGRGNNIMVDGAEADGDSGSVRLTLSQDAVEEFQINRSNYSAEFGGASGGVINIISKSGTNQFHGSAYGFFRDDALDARDPFAIAPPPVSPFVIGLRGTPVKPPSNRQQFGATAGFPLVRDRTFAFVAYEHLRRDESSDVPVLTDTAIFAPRARQADILAGLASRGSSPVPCLSSPATVLPASTCAFVLGRILSIDPTTAGPPESPFMALSEPYIVRLFAQNSGIFPFRARSDQFSVRIDHEPSERNVYFLRYNLSHSKERNTNLQALVGFSRGNQIDDFDSTIALGWFHHFSARSQNEARAQWNYGAFDVSPNDHFGPQIDIAGFGFFNRDYTLPSYSTIRRYEFADNWTLNSGRHTFKLGGSLLLRGLTSENHTFFGGRVSFGDLPGGLLSPCLAAPAACGLSSTQAPSPLSALQSVKLGLPQFYAQGFGNPDLATLLPLAAYYAQDNWAPRSDLNLNFGVRYELDKRRVPLRTDTNNLAPRFGFAWTPSRGKKTVVRGGFGIYYSPTYIQIDNVVQTLGLVNGLRQIAQVFIPLTGVPGLPGIDSAVIFQTLLAEGAIGCASASQEACVTSADLAQFGISITHSGPVPPFSVLFSPSKDYENPYSQQASFGIERELANNLSLSVDYIFAHTLKIPRARDKNLLVPPRLGPLGIQQWTSPDPCPTPFACFANPLLLQDNVYESTARSYYDGLLLTVNKRFTHHLSVLADYTFSKAIDDVTDFNSDFSADDQLDLKGERALSAFDQRHKLVIAAVVESPWRSGPNSGALARFLSGFTVSPLVRGNSGHPFNLLVGSDINGDRHSTTDRPPFSGRNTGRGPDFWAFDLRVGRRIPLGERRSLELLAESFNLSNMLNFASVNNTVGLIGPPFNLTGRRDRTPSQPLGFTSAFDRRRIQLGCRFNF